MTTKHLLTALVLATLAGVPALAQDGDHSAEAEESHEEENHEHEDDHDHAEHEDDDHAEHEDDDHADEVGDHLSTMGDLRLVHGWTRATDDDTALIFVEIENTGDTSFTLTGGASHIADTVTLVAFTTVDGEPTYQDLPALPIAPGTDMVLAPQGVALRLDGVSQDLVEGDSFEVVVSFAENNMALTVEVEDAEATQHGHAGHNH